MNKRLILQIVAWNVVMLAISLFTLAAFIDANPMAIEQQYALATIWLLATFMLATGLAYNVHKPKERVNAVKPTYAARDNRVMVQDEEKEEAEYEGIP